jgi:hypothetical protein
MRPTIMLVLGLLIILGTVTDVVAQAVTPYNIELTPLDRKRTSLIPVPSNTPSAPEGPGSSPMIGTPPGHLANAGGTFVPPPVVPGLGDAPSVPGNEPGPGPMIHDPENGNFVHVGGMGSGPAPSAPGNGPGPGPMIHDPQNGNLGVQVGGTIAGPPGLGDGGLSAPGNAPSPRAAATGLGGILKKASATSHPCPPNCGAYNPAANADVPRIRTLQPRTSLSSSTSNVDLLRRSGSEKMQSAVALSGGNKTKINMAIPTSVPVLAKRAIDIKTPATLPPAQISGIKR